MNLQQTTLRVMVLTSVLVSGASFGQQAQPEQTPVIKSTVDEVVLDVVVRDKKGKPVKDLTIDDFQVTDNGVKQKPTSVRLVEGKEALSQGARVPLDPMRQVRLVTMVFEPLGIESRRRAKQAALDLIKGDQGTNVFYSVAAIDSRLYALQSFTNDRELLKTAIDKATSGQFSTFSNESALVKARLQEILANPITPPAVCRRRQTQTHLVIVSRRRRCRAS
ncbi:MAG: VWA domain-containing protein [Bryobacterales bacterium]|nr:VWA domain-containing protein [Bryobacterales bacterium]